ncbi:beta-ketoacyl synthase N-terminal-like domain-containing protein [Alicyclobacillus fodiniaquatilis]|uniref:Beta-ketoacyl synthase N-terminal-like domain-containing protein n=1 Tax=Alicyclobacillus fodiniaquatilis TaxID=1661150 RepID=A0ABW4JMV6_9BACL
MSKLLNFKQNDSTPNSTKSASRINEVSMKEIAIIGAAVYYPKAENLDDFWKNLMEEVDCSGDLPTSRENDISKYLQFNNLLKEDTKFFKGSYLEEVDKFDYKYFGLTPKEAELMDPNQRLFLQTAWKALEDAGYGGEKLVGSKTGVYVSSESRKGLSYQQLIHDIEPESLVYSLPGNSVSMIPSRISYILDLHGPAVMIDTACSGALATVHLASQALRNGEIDQAIAGGVKINFLPLDVNMRVGIESSDGRTKTFSDNSDGTTVGEGVAALILKPLYKAIRDKDHVYAAIKGSAMNHDGHAIGVTAPNMLAQEQLILDAWKDAGVNPENISYIEAHGTGTLLGDPIEIGGIQRAFKRFTDRKQFCAIGSVKSNMSHTDNLAGVTGLLKTIMSLKHKKIPATLYFEKPNHKIAFEESPVYVNDTLSEWMSEGVPLQCGVSAFGMSGTNCHVVLEEAPLRQRHHLDELSGPHLLTLSAVSKQSLERIIADYRQRLAEITESETHLADVCFTANTGRGHYQHRLAVIAHDVPDLLEKLNRLDLDKWSQGAEGTIFYNAQARSFQSEKANGYLEESAATLQNRETILVSLAGLYVQGAAINWDMLYDRLPVQRVSLPTYPFERTRCWMDISLNPNINIQSQELLQTHLELLTYLQKQTQSDETNKEKLQGFIRILKKYSPSEEHPVKRKIELTGRESGFYTQKELEIAEIWQKVLGITTLNIHDDFFTLGGDSFIAIQIVSQLHKNYEISLNDVFTYTTLENMAANLNKRPENTQNKIETLKQFANRSEQYLLENSDYVEREQAAYRKRNDAYKELNLQEIKTYQHILITGVTGYLGIHLMFDILKATDSDVHVLIRSNSVKAAESRLAAKWQYYFADNLLENEAYRSRVRIVIGDLTKEHFGMSLQTYETLTGMVDCVIHAAGLVKHFGTYDSFEETNVKGTERLVQFSLQGIQKDFNMISSTAVARGRVQNEQLVVYSEYDTNIGQEINNPYGKSKLEAEKVVLAAREQGLNCHIFRVGNIMFDSKTGRFQENIEDNGLYTILKAMIKMRLFPDIQTTEIDFSYIDYVSRSICLLFNRKHLENEIFHIFNPNKSSLFEVAEAVRKHFSSLQIVSFNEFVDFISERSADPDLSSDINNLLLHMGFFDYLGNGGGGTHFHVLADKTALLLEKMGVNWNKPTQDQMDMMLAHCLESNFI